MVIECHIMGMDHCDRHLTSMYESVVRGHYECHRDTRERRRSHRLLHPQWPREGLDFLAQQNPSLQLSHLVHKSDTLNAISMCTVENKLHR